MKVIFITSTLLCTVALAGQPLRMSVEEVRAWSYIQDDDYTLEEQQTLALVSKSPKRTRDALVTIHQNRIRDLRVVLDGIQEHYDRHKGRCGEECYWGSTGYLVRDRKGKFNGLEPHLIAERLEVRALLLTDAMERLKRRKL